MLLTIVSSCVIDPLNPEVFLSNIKIYLLPHKEHTVDSALHIFTRYVLRPPFILPTPSAECFLRRLIAGEQSEDVHTRLLSMKRLSFDPGQYDVLTY